MGRILINWKSYDELDLSDRLRLAESWITKFKDSDLEDPDDYDIYNDAISTIIEAIESGRYHLTRRYKKC